MPNELTLCVSPEISATPALLRKEVEKILVEKGLVQSVKIKKSGTILGIHVRKRSIDARGRTPGDAVAGAGVWRG
jgi:hypothetical protein